MLRLAKWWLRDEFIELRDGTALYYIHDFTGPGYVLQGDQRHRLEGLCAVLGWVFFIYLAVPDGHITSWLITQTGEFFGAEYVIKVLLLVLLLLSLYALKVNFDRFLDTLDRRDPSHWDDDLKLRAKAAETTNGASPFWVLAVLIIGGWMTGFALEIALGLSFSAP